MKSLALASALAFGAMVVPSAAAEPLPDIPRRLPPPGVELSATQVREVEAALAHLAERAAEEPGRTDIAAVRKAVRFALENGEFYDPARDLAKIRDLVRACDGPPRRRGLLVRGYRSEIDSSWQPYGLDVPEGLDLTGPVPLWIWLHGRGDKETDLHFLHNRLTKGGQFRPGDAIVLHPFGRQCVGWKHAGEVDVFEALGAVGAEFEIDPGKIALCGFSMGGAGAWHLGAHYADRFAAVHAGAGFAETARYIGLKPEDFPPPWEQALWGAYDVPCYARNLLNVPLIAYSGEDDKQIQAARVMEEALAGEGHTLRHVIGPGMGHKYHPDSAREIEGFVSAALRAAPGVAPDEVHLQTRTLRYGRMHWVEATGLEKHWSDSRVDAARGPWGYTVRTKNVSSLRFDPKHEVPGTVDGQPIGPAGAGVVSLVKRDGRWAVGEPEPGPRKRPGLQGPIDDAFTGPFLVALPSATPESELHARWVAFEIDHFKKRWKELMRGELRTKPEDQLTGDDFARYHIIAWGTPESSGLVRAVQQFMPEHDPETQIVAMIRPNPRDPDRYLVVNSGLTFREAHDRTNSLQNPKLGDWAVIDLRTAPSAEAPGEVLRSGFFDERWRH